MWRVGQVVEHVAARLIRVGAAVALAVALEGPVVTQGQVEGVDANPSDQGVEGDQRIPDLVFGQFLTVVGAVLV
jgi:hypothetical protein